jgi:hypothetical protein
VVDFEYWLDGLVGTCELICKETTLRQVGIDGDENITSIYDYNELDEQLVDDLQIDSWVQEFTARIDDAAMVQALLAFSGALHKLDQAIDALPALQSPEILLNSSHWSAFRQSASGVVESPYAPGYQNHQKTNQILQRLRHSVPASE